MKTHSAIALSLLLGCLPASDLLGESDSQTTNTTSTSVGVTVGSLGGTSTTSGPTTTLGTTTDAASTTEAVSATTGSSTSTTTTASGDPDTDTASTLTSGTTNAASSSTGSNTCTLPLDCRLIFVTLNTWTGNELGGISGADEACTNAAKALYADAHCNDHWDDSTTWIAWLADNVSQDPQQFIEMTAKDITTCYMRPDHYLVANNWADLSDGNLQSPINSGKFNVWTNVKTDGTANGVDLDMKEGYELDLDCDNWEKEAQMPDLVGNTGISNETDEKWTEHSTLGCEQAAHLYCIAVKQQ